MVFRCSNTAFDHHHGDSRRGRKGLANKTQGKSEINGPESEEAIDGNRGFASLWGAENHLKSPRLFEQTTQYVSHDTTILGH